MKNMMRGLLVLAVVQGTTMQCPLAYRPWTKKKPSNNRTPSPLSHFDIVNIYTIGKCYQSVRGTSGFHPLGKKEFMGFNTDLVTIVLVANPTCNTEGKQARKNRRERERDGQREAERDGQRERK